MSVNSSIASIGKEYPFRKNHSFSFSTVRKIFACLEYSNSLSKLGFIIQNLYNNYHQSKYNCNYTFGTFQNYTYFL